MVHSDGTMDVLFNGLLERRKYQFVILSIHRSTEATYESLREIRAEPELNEGEEAFYPITGSTRPPIIMKVW